MRLEIETSEMDGKDAAAIIGLLIVRFPTALSELMATAAKLDGIIPPIEIVGEPALQREAADDAFVPPADAAFTPPLDTPAANGAAAPDGSLGTSETTAAAAPPPAPKPPASAEVDSEGLPWDARIHGEGKNKTKAGAWRKRRNLSPDVEKAVTAELKAAMAAPAAAAPPAPAAPIPPAPAPAAAAPPPPSDPVTPAPPVAPPPSEAPATAAPPAPAAVGTEPAALSGPALFAATMRKVTEAQTAGRITPELVAEACRDVGLTGVRDLLPRTDLIPAFEAMFESKLAPAAA